MGPLLCELHTHTRWSDGELGVAELVDLYGRNGFDVVCITDHVVRSDDPWRECLGLRFRSVAPSAMRVTQAFARDETLRGLAHRFELFNRSQLFAWVAHAGLPAVATGDAHRPEHVAGWKTLLPCRHEESAVVEYVRSARPVYLARFDGAVTRAAA